MSKYFFHNNLKFLFEYQENEYFHSNTLKDNMLRKQIDP